jgi:hypothetical protein
MTGQSQDIDSRTGKTINHGEPVQHDVVDGQSTGHSVEPETAETNAPAGGKPAAPAPDPLPPQRVTRDEIYAKAKRQQEQEIAQNLDAMSPEDRMQYDRMVAEAGGGPDPYAAEETPPDTPEQAAQAQQQEAQAQPAQQQTPQSADPALASNEETVSIIVYGMREEVPRSNVEAAGGIEAYQKNRAADEKLRRLTTYEASLRDLDQQLQQQADRVRRSPPPGVVAGGTEPSPTDVPDSAEDLREMAREVATGFYSGNEEEAVEKLTSAFERIQTRSTRAAQPTLPEQPAAQQQYYPQQPAQQGPTPTDMNEANAVFANEFGDLQTPVLRSAVLAMVGQVQQEPLMRGRPLAEVTREAAMRVRADVKDVRPENPQTYRESTVPTDLGERMQLKSRTVVAPLHQASQRAPTGAADEPQYPSNSEYVQQMRQRRNQPRTG